MAQPRNARLRWLAAAGGLAGAAAALFWMFDAGQPAAPAASSSSLAAPASGVTPVLAAAPSALPLPAPANAAQAAAQPDDGPLPAGSHVAIPGNANDAFAKAIHAASEKQAAEPPAAIAQAKSFREAFDAMQQAERQPPAPSAGLNPFGK